MAKEEIANDKIAKDKIAKDKRKRRIEGKAVFKHMAKDFYQLRLAFLVLFLYFVLTDFFFHSSCPLVLLFGISCPGCGLTRAAACVLMGDFAGAFQQNGTIFLWILLGIYALWKHYRKGAQGKEILAATIFCGGITWCYYVIRWLNRTLPEPGYVGIFNLIK